MKAWRNVELIQNTKIYGEKWNPASFGKVYDDDKSSFDVSFLSVFFFAFIFPTVMLDHGIS